MSLDGNHTRELVNKGIQNKTLMDALTISAGGALGGGLSAELAGGDFAKGATQGAIVAGLNHLGNHAARNSRNFSDGEDQVKPSKEVTLKSLGITSKDTAESSIAKIMEGMKPGDYISGDAFNFIKPDAGDYIKTVTRLEGNNFKITTKGFGTGLMLKNNSTITINETKTFNANIIKSNVYKVSINGLTDFGKKNMYQYHWINDNTRYTYGNGIWTPRKIK